MRCKVCGGRGHIGFVQVWKLTTDGENIGGKPMFVHKACKSKLHNIKEVEVKESIAGWFKKKLARTAVKEAEAKNKE